MENTAQKQRKVGKLTDKFLGPYTVNHHVGKGLYELKNNPSHMETWFSATHVSSGIICAVLVLFLLLQLAVAIVNWINFVRLWNMYNYKLPFLHIV